MTAGQSENQNARSGVRVAFWLYALALVISTHWPNLEAPDIGIERPDILIHLGVFGLWTLLLLATEYSGPRIRWKSTAFGWLIALAYAAVDESTQALPGVNRHAAWDDYGANALGITLACLVWGGAIRPLLAKRNRYRPRRN